MKPDRQRFSVVREASLTNDGTFNDFKLPFGIKAKVSA